MRNARVVVGIDRSLAGLRALRWAVNEARRRNVELYAVRAWRFGVAWQGAEVRQWRRDFEVDAAGEIQAAFREALGGPPPDVAVHALVAEGQVPQVLAAFACGDDDLIVVGDRRSRRGLWRWGGIGPACLRESTCPVVTVPADAWAQSGRSRSLERRLRREAEEYLAAVDDRTPSGPNGGAS